MRNSIILLFIGCLSMGAAYDNDLPLTKKMSAWITVAGKGFANEIRKESPKTWYDCGINTPQADWDARGMQIAEATARSMRRHRLKVDPCGVIAVAYNESRGNRCSIGPHPRKIAQKLNLLPKDKHWREYNQEDIINVLKDPKWISRRYKADVGVYQDVYPTYARIIDKQGDLQCYQRYNTKCRLPTPEELVDLTGSTEVGIHGMLARVLFFKTKEPWTYWPWTIRTTYSRAVENTRKKICAKWKWN